MTGGSPELPVLFCFDGSEGSRRALRAASELIVRPVDAVVLTVWESLATRLARTGAFVGGSAAAGADLDGEEASYATSVAERGGAPGERARVQSHSHDQGVLRWGGPGHP